MNSGSYPSPGKCIFCGDKSEKRTREHIIPKALNGTYVIQDATCPRCQRILDKFEAATHRVQLIGPRRHLGLKGHTPASQQRKRLPLRCATPQGEQTVLIDAGDYPAILGFPKFAPFEWKGIETPPDGATLIALTSRWLHGDQALLLAKYGVESPILAQTMFADFYRYLAKIAHSFAVAELGVDGFRAFLPKHIVNTDRDDESLKKFIGGRVIDTESAGLHNIHQGWMRAGEHNFVVVNIQLFAQFDMPAYTVLVGAMPDTPVPDWAA